MRVTEVTEDVTAQCPKLAWCPSRERETPRAHASRLVRMLLRGFCPGQLLDSLGLVLKIKFPV